MLFPTGSRSLAHTLAAATALFCVGAPVLAIAAAKPAAKPAASSYEKDVLPLFQARCVSCHGAGHPEAGLDIRTHGELMQGGYSGSPVVRGAPEKSLLYQMLADGRMPKGGKLSPAELKRVEQWIRASAPGRSGEGGHWAFRPPVQAPLPAVKAASRVRNPVDRFLLADLENHGLSFSPEADRRSLIRRVTFDLTGLPPTPEEVSAFEVDRSPDAYEKVVDRLLASQAYGERSARLWLDTAGYAESEGVLQEDRLRPNAWRYRDYVIRAFNDDKPYDRFLQEQIAGDELVDYRNAKTFTPEIVESLTATGFLRTAVDGTRDDFNAHQYGEYQYRMLHDTETIVASTAMGLTLQCSRCHNHKYEPLSQKDYYRIQALFTGAVRPRGTILPTNRRQIVAATADEQANAKKVNTEVDAAVRQLDSSGADLVDRYGITHAQEHKAEIPEADRDAVLAAVQVERAKRTPAQKALIDRYGAIIAPAPQKLVEKYPDFKKEWAAIQSARAAEERKRITLTELRAFYDQDATPPATPLLTRGDWLRPGDAVEPGVPTILDDPRRPFTIPAPPPGAATTGRRRAFAEWLTRPEHPLTARVMANRIWAQHFGVGIVPSTENFGKSGIPPTNAPLLDWLAVSFTRSGWSVKALHRLIVTSSAYRQSAFAPKSPVRSSQLEPLLWRQRRRRIDAEQVRDAMLAVSGTLDATMYGEPVGNETRPTGEIVASGEEKRGRRSIYILVRRSMPVTLLNAFDQPVMETNCTRRVTSTTATQALALMNSAFISAQAGHFARRVLKEKPPFGAPETPLDEATIGHAYRLALGRAPSQKERGATLAFLKEQIARYRAEPAATPARAMEQAYADFCQALLSSNEFVYLD